jgi:endonuclease G
MLEAASRWSSRDKVRVAGLNTILSKGIGAADPQKQQVEWTLREANKSRRGIQRFERTIGTTQDYFPFAPSALAANAAKPVARIVTLPGGGYEPQGVATGFMVGESILLTNHHVFSKATDVIGYGANFQYIQDDRGINQGTLFEFEPDRFFLSDEELDFAFVAVKRLGLSGNNLGNFGSVSLIEATGKILTGLPVNIIQHPNGWTRQYAVTNNRLTDILDAGFLHYETDTARGSSGSPVFNRDWELVALHHAGIPLVINGHVMNRDEEPWDPDTQSDDEIKWVANEGTRVSAIVSRLRDLKAVNEDQRRIQQALLESTVDAFGTPSGNESSSELNNMTAKGAIVGNTTFTFSGPVTINVLGSSTPSQIPASVSSTSVDSVNAKLDTPPSALAPEKSLLFDANFETRGGYDPDFLGIKIDMPTVVDERLKELYNVSDYKRFDDEYRNVGHVDTSDLADDDPLVLRYHHYSLVMNKVFRACMWSASNCDYRDIARQDGRPRKAFGSENWRLDPRVPPLYQLDNKDVYAPALRVDRGHIVRREDNCWGAAGIETEFANSDTFFYTNCSPQHEAFNQENPDDKSGRKIYSGTGQVGIWGRFEAELAAKIQSSGGQAVIFAGPVLKDMYEATDWGTGKVQIPKKFWKVVIIPDSDRKNPKLLAYGFLFDQKNVVKKYGFTYTKEAIDLTEFDRQSKSLAFISELTGVLFSDDVMAADQTG